MRPIKISLSPITALTFAASAFAQKPEIIEAAEKGNVSAQLELGYGFRDGSYGKKDNQKAFEWFSKAAATNNPEALDNLGWLVENGRGTPADGAKARKLYRRAAD
jgi:TPR repeat protein